MLKYLIYLTIFSLPLYIIRFKIGSIPMTLLEVLILLTSFIWLLINIINIKNLLRNRAKRLKIISDKYNIIAILWALIGFISAMVSADKISGLGIFKAYFLEPVLFFLILQTTIKTRKKLVMAFISLLCSGYGVAILTIVQYITKWNPFAPYEIAQGRASGVYNSANAVGLFLGPMIGFLLALIFIYTKKNKLSLFKNNTLLLLLVLTTLLSAVILTFSEGSIFSVISIIILLIFFKIGLDNNVRGWYQKFRKIFLVFITLMFIGNIFILFLSPVFTKKLPDRPQNRIISNTGVIRLCLWDGTIKMLKQKTIFGAGLNGFSKTYRQYYTCDSELLQYPHNIILNFWSETGIFGLIIFFILCFFYFKDLLKGIELYVRIRPVDTLPIKIAGGLILAMVYWLVHGLVDVPYFKNDLSMEFWILIAFSVISLRIFSISEPQEENK